MKNYHLPTLTLLFALFFSVSSFAQCVIPITDGQPYVEDFEGSGFDCWTVEANGGTWAPMAGTQNTAVCFSWNNAGDEARLISPTFDMSTVETVTFSFSYNMMGMYENDELVVSFRTSEGDAWHTLGTYSFSDWSNTYEESFTLDNLSSTYQVSFLGRGFGGYLIFVDNIEIVSAASCARPTNLQATEITTSSALLGWSTTGNEESWTIEINGSQKTVDIQPFLMDNLEPQTDYTFRVKANCGDGMTSEWSLPITFKTLCDVIVVTDDEPYFDDFESSDEFVCWQNEVSSGEDEWVVDPGYTIPNNTAFFIWLGGEALLYSAPLDITAVTNPTLEFKHRQWIEDNRWDYLYVAYRTSPTDTWHVIGSYTDPATDWETVALALPEVSATLQIGFDGVSNNGAGVYVDDVRVGNAQNVGVGETVEITNGDAVVYDLFGRKVADAAFREGRLDLDMSRLASGIYVVRISNEQGVKTMKIVKE